MSHADWLLKYVLARGVEARRGIDPSNVHQVLEHVETIGGSPSHAWKSVHRGAV